MTVVSLSCSPSYCWDPGYFVLNDLWVQDTTHHVSQCGAGGGVCWVEAGYISYNPTSTSSAVWYVWADLRPNSTFFKHFIAQVPSGDIGKSAAMNINYQGSNKWQVISSTPSGVYYNYSTANTMTADDINIGQELYGTGGASAPTAHFTYNYWIDTSGAYHFQTGWSSSGIHVYNPPYGGWTTYPSPSGTGGNWHTSCC